jgi:hypothetical protein
MMCLACSPPPALVGLKRPRLHETNEKASVQLMRAMKKAVDVFCSFKRGGESVVVESATQGPGSGLLSSQFDIFRRGWLRYFDLG